LRHGAFEGLRELSKSFQLVIFTMVNEKYTNYLIDVLDKESIFCDAVY
jgi:TFIIF-interacting CTD phosphatase-like protein